jgi:FeS assembly SUF system protein
MTDTAPIRRFEIELVDEVPPPAKAPPLQATPGRQQPRERDFLEGFLTERNPAPDDGETVVDRVVAALRDIYDPEIPVNIYDLGLIYNVEEADGHVVVTMTLTTPHCPVAETMPGEVELRVLAVPGVATADVNLVWDPPWNPASMSDEARLELGML